ncbi:bifunctional (p)ppGpp synthetase/guanosine-3',5'-bis(diphosphate) 3'-pyrophosphohydrolase [Candidatus Micrarchaeota archaeon]|nr:bifunctional (p)ppGpp synthetase/guanosine-3',5'-bis(diphosphate) 3'-pyrophosphohydrolase [Candidatus Micrarchaeota archaeon]
MKKTPKDIVEKAARIAVVAHAKQKRKGDGSPYIVHPFRVALKLAQNGFSDEVIAAALVHDVLEDTTYPEKKLRRELGESVYRIVKAVTNDDSLSWEEKKRKYVQTVRAGPAGAKAVCVADKIHNMESLLTDYQKQGPAIWKKFNRGKKQKKWFERMVLEMLRETFKHPLVDEYAQLIEREEKLK